MKLRLITIEGRVSVSHNSCWPYVKTKFSQGSLKKLAGTDLSSTVGSRDDSLSLDIRSRPVKLLGLSPQIFLIELQVLNTICDFRSGVTDRQPGSAEWIECALIN